MFRLSAGLFSCALGFSALLLAAPASAVTIDWVTVGDPGNPADTATNCGSPNCGSVAETFRISKFEVTNAQYVELLNAKAAEDPLGLYNPDMGSSAQGGITQAGTSGSFTYSVKPGFENKPVTFVSFFDSLRFTNWLNNGQGSGDTETGAYTLLGGTLFPSNGSTVTRNANANIFLPSENEWFKAAFWDLGTQSFLDFPAGSNSPTVCAAPGATPNTANCENVNGNVTDVGAFTGSASPNGTFDQGGNVSEWNERLLLEGRFRGVRGGSWNSSASDLAASDPFLGSPAFEFVDVGFRVAGLVPVPEPGTMALVITGLAALAAKPRRS